jgi:hypothetical protein
MDQLLEAPEVSGLAGEDGAVDVGQRRERGGVVAAEVAEEVSVGAQLPELADQLLGNDLAVGELGLGAALTQAAGAEGLQFVVHEAEYRKQEFLRGHGGRSLSTEWYSLM